MMSVRCPDGSGQLLVGMLVNVSLHGYHGITQCIRVIQKDDGTTRQTTGQQRHRWAVIRATCVRPVVCPVVLTTEWATMGQKMGQHPGYSAVAEHLYPT